jgi:hypothetical protein
MLYRSRFFDTLALTAHYHAIRIHYGKAAHATAAARHSAEGSECDAFTRDAMQDLGRMKSALQSYDTHLGSLLGPAAASESARRSLAQDFVLNPTAAFIDARSAALSRHAPPPDLFPA